MNKIYIINDFLSCEILLNFKDNTFDINNNLFKFDLIDKDKILIFWDDNEQIFYSDDSYLFFSDLSFKTYYKKIFLIHSEWEDQAIINLNNNILHRIIHKNQYGNIRFEEDILIIDWNYWGEEKYYKRDDYTYIQEDYNIILLQDNKNIIPIHIFIHICLIEDWRDIFEDQIKKIKDSGLYNIVEKIHLGIVGDLEKLNDKIFFDEKFDILYIDKRTSLYEIHTINHIKSFCNDIEYEVYILYIHTKGVRNAGNKNVIQSWRNMMEYFLIEKYEECIKYLSIYDTLGNNIVNSYCYDIDKISVNKLHTCHYSGNFWWSTKTHIDKLDFIKLDLSKNSINTRFRAENWILSNYPNMNIGLLFQDNTNTHPYHRYVYDYYKRMNLFIRIATFCN